MSPLRRAITFFGPDWPRILLVLLAIMIGAGLNLLKPWPVALIVDSVLGDKAAPAWLDNLTSNKAGIVTLLCGAVAVLHIAHGLISAIGNYLSIAVGLRGLRRVRNQLFDQLQRLSLRFFHGQAAGDLIYRASWDTYSFQTLFQQGLITFTTSAISLGLMIFVMAQLSVKLTVVSILVVPPLVLTIRLAGKPMTRYTGAAQEADSRVTGFVQQAISTMQLVQSFTREKRQALDFAERTRSAEGCRLKQHGIELVYWWIIAVIFGVGTSVMVYLGSQEVLAGRLTVGTLFIFLAYLAQLYEPLNQISHVGATVSGASAGIRRVFELLDSGREIKSPEKPVPFPKPAKDSTAVEFNNVTFGYDPKRPVLKNISFQIRSQESVALIGPSGAGKSTILNLISRFYDADAGDILLFGTNLRELKLKETRSNISYVFQEPLLVPGTVAENIAYARPDASQEEIERAAQAANAHLFIEKLPKGYNSVVGEGALRLSVGEKQRINLARAFLKDAPILLLDEPTSALDAETEALVTDSITTLMKGRTTIIVAHRLSTIAKVERIFELQNGVIKDSGSPAELLKRQSYYARLSST